MVEQFDSTKYWRERYWKRGYSGPGSIGRLARYKASYVNDLVSRRGIRSIIEFGSGDGKQAMLFDFPHYTGIEISTIARWKSRIRCAWRITWKFRSERHGIKRPRDMSMSLDVIYHLVEDDVFEAYMNVLFKSARRYVLIYSSDGAVGASGMHIRHRCYSDWIRENRPEWQLIEAPDHPYPQTPDSDPETTSFASFKLFAKEEVS